MGQPQSTGAESMLTTYCRELASMTHTLHGLLDHTVRRGLPLGQDADAMSQLLDPLDALRELIHAALGESPATPAASDPPEVRRAEPRVLEDDGSERPVETLRHLGLEKLDLSGVQMSLDEVFSDGGFDEQSPRPFRRLVVDDLSDTFGVPRVLGEQENPSPARDLRLRDGTPAGRREKSRAQEAPRVPIEELLVELRKSYEGTKVTMEGTTESLPIQTVFESLSASQKTGTLHLRTDYETLVFELQSGDVVFAASDSAPPGDRLGDILVQRGWLDPRELRGALDRQVDAPNRLGSALEKQELVTREQLQKAIEEQIHRHFLRAFQTRRAAYAFAKGTREDFGRRVRLNISRLLFESARVADENERDRAAGQI